MTKAVKLPKSKKIVIDLKYRDEKCSGCKQKFRAGHACEGYSEFILTGYHDVGLDRKQILCHQCTQIVYRLIGCPSWEDHTDAPTALYSFDLKKDDIKKRPDSMSINGKHQKFDRVKLVEAVRKYSDKQKKINPWNHVDYYKLAGVMKTKKEKSE